MMNQLSQETRACIEAALACHAACRSTAMLHCLEMGGEHVEPQHFRLMLDCAILCGATAELMTQKSRFHRQMCALCAEACEACAQDCLRIGGMEECVAACNECAFHCRKMAG